MPIGNLYQFRSIEEQRLPRVDGQCRRTDLGHQPKGGHSDDRNVKAHVLPGLADLDHRDRLIADKAGGPANGGVGTFHGLHRHTGLVPYHHGLADIHASHLLGDPPTVVNVLDLRIAGRPPGQHTGLGHQRFQERGGIDQTDPFLLQDVGNPSNQGVGVSGTPDSSRVSRAAGPARSN